ncbi:MAG: FIVAR domain-containing protein, partial [Acutalibacteraceae bacterium]
MAISKRVISVIMTVAMLLTVVQIGVSAIDVSSGESVESTQVMVDDGTGKIISPTVTVTASPVVRVASATGALTPGTTIVSATPSGIPYITGNYTKEAYAGETPTNAMITFKSDLSLANNKNVTITCVNNSTVTFTVTNPDNNTWIWTITGGTAQAGTYLDFEIGYSYTYTDKLTQKSITKSYKAYASSYVEGIAQPAGVYFNNYRTKPTFHSGTYGDMVYRILGIGTYGSYYDDGTAGAGDSYKKDASVWAHGYYDFINVDSISAPSSNGPGSVVGWGTNAANAQGYGLVLWGKDNGDGNKYGNTGLDPQRPVSTTYIDSSTGTALNNANINLRYTVFDEARGYSSGEYFRALTSSAVLPGEVAWDSSYSSDYTATTQLGFGAINEVVILNEGKYPESEFRLTNYALSVPFNGTTYKDAMTTLTDGTKYVAYTFITKLTTNYTTGRDMWNHSAVDLRFYMYNKADIKSLVNEMLTENPPVSPTGPETGINPQESYYSSGWTAYKTALTNAQRVIAKPNVMQADIDAAKTALDEAKANLVVATADYTAVNLALSTAAGLDPSLYTPDSWARVTAARTAVKENYTVFYQPAVDKMATDLNAAIDALVEADADYTNVDAAIEAANAIDRSVYSDATLKTLDDAVANASTVENRSKKISQQAFVDALAEAIYDAIDALQYKLADYTAVNNAIARYEALDQNLYTTASWSRVQANREAIVMNLNITMQAEVDEMAANLNSAIDKLVKKPADYTAVDAKIDEALLLDESNYTPASWQKLMNAIDSVVYDLTIDQQSTVDGYAAAITSA